MLQIWQTGQGSRVLMENSPRSLVEKKWLNSILFHRTKDENPKHFSSSIFYKWVAIELKPTQVVEILKLTY